MRRLRFRLRTVMVAILAIAPMLGGGIWVTRLDQRVGIYRERVFYFSRQEQIAIDMLAHAEKAVIRFSAFPGSASTVENRRDRVEETKVRVNYYSSMRKKYERGISRPWELLSDDPPEPPIPLK